MPTSKPSQIYLHFSSSASDSVVFLSRKVNSFLDKMNPTEGQMASFIDTMRDQQWPEFPPAAPPPPPRTDEEKNETRGRAHNLISARCRGHLSAVVGNNIQLFLAVDYKSQIYFYTLSLDSNYLVLKKTDMESVFNLFQDRQENKTLVYVSISTFNFLSPSMIISCFI